MMPARILRMFHADRSREARLYARALRAELKKERWEHVNVLIRAMNHARAMARIYRMHIREATT